MIRGRCECSAIEYEVSGDVADLSHCHCSQCRRLQGAPYVSFATVRAAQIQWRSGREALKVYASSPKNARYFCPDCGAHVMVISQDEPDTVYLTAGCMVGDPALPGGYHEFVDSKAPWVKIRDDEPQHPGPADS